MKVYLGGPINGCTDEEANGWREAAKEQLDDWGVPYLDPMDRDYRGREMELGIAAEIVENDKKDIDQCDVILLNCPKPSVGTAMEAMYAYMKSKPIVAVHPKDKEPSPWLVYHASRIYPSVKEALEAL